MRGNTYAYAVVAHSHAVTVPQQLLYSLEILQSRVYKIAETARVRYTVYYIVYACLILKGGQMMHDEIDEDETANEFKEYIKSRRGIRVDQSNNCDTLYE